MLVGQRRSKTDAKTCLREEVVSARTRAHAHPSHRTSSWLLLSRLAAAGDAAAATAGSGGFRLRLELGEARAIDVQDAHQL